MWRQWRPITCMPLIDVRRLCWWRASTHTIFANHACTSESLETTRASDGAQSSSGAFEIATVSAPRPQKHANALGAPTSSRPRSLSVRIAVTVSQPFWTAASVLSHWIQMAPAATAACGMAAMCARPTI